MNKTYRHLFFDLDRTIWDFETNSKLAFEELFQMPQFKSICPSLEEFLPVYHSFNDALWERFRRGTATKTEVRDQRFVQTFESFGVMQTDKALEMSELYVGISPQKTALMPHAIEVLGTLKKSYHLHIISNGFIEAQKVKIEKSGLSPFFDRIITSEMAKAAKPNPEIFHLALSSAHAKKKECLMIGDDWNADIMGARKFGIDQVFFNPEQSKVPLKATYEIVDLIDLLEFL